EYYDGHTNCKLEQWSQSQGYTPRTQDSYSCSRGFGLRRWLVLVCYRPLCTFGVGGHAGTSRSPRHVDLVKPFPVIAASGGPDNFKDQDWQQADDTRCSVVNQDCNEDEFGFRGAEIVCYRPLCSGKASFSSCYTKSHVDTTSTCYLFCIIISDPSSQSSA